MCQGCVPTAPSWLSPCLSSQGTLEGLEEELLAFFSVTPHSVYTALMDNRYFPISGSWDLGFPVPQGCPRLQRGLGSTGDPLASPQLGTPTWPGPCGALGVGCTWGSLHRGLWHFVLPICSVGPREDGGQSRWDTLVRDKLALTLSPLPQL